MNWLKENLGTILAFLIVSLIIGSAIYTLITDGLESFLGFGSQNRYYDYQER